MTSQDRPRLRAADGREDPAVRRQRFEHEHPEAVILPPCAGRWRAVARGRTLGSWGLGGLMDQLDQLYPDGGAS